MAVPNTTDMQLYAGVVPKPRDCVIEWGLRRAKQANIPCCFRLQKRPAKDGMKTIITYPEHIRWFERRVTLTAALQGTDSVYWQSYFY